MWSLVMGGTFSSDDDESGEVLPEDKEIDRLDKSNSLDSLALIHKDVHLAKHRIPSPTRERGDGSDAVPPSPKKAETFTEHQNLSAVKLIRLPRTNIRLEKLPPINRNDNVELPKTEPSSPLVLLTTGNPIRAERPSPRRDKEPKFVPYEPYKAAVTPIVHLKKKKKSSRATPPKGVDESSTEQDDKSVGTTCDKVEVHPAVVVVVAGRELRLEEKDREIEALKRELAEKEKQLRIQTQVNCEVKRLLIASVGEDIEAKVDYLTQDKARLSADIRHYASKISRDFEEKEQLSVESNLWKSKFLACSVIVDELARWKASLMHRSEEYEHNIRLLLHEHAVLWSTLMETFTVLTRLRSALDPLGASLKTAEAASLLGLADHTLKLGLQLRSRLIGETKLKGVDSRKGITIPDQMDTPAEEALRQTMARPINDGNSDYSELASIAVTGAAKPHLTKLGDQLTSPSGFKNCTHCHGVVQNL